MSAGAILKPAPAQAGVIGGLKKAATTVGGAVKKDSRFSYPGFGTWSMRTRKARKIRNPQTNEIMKLKATKTIGFRPAKELKDTL